MGEPPAPPVGCEDANDTTLFPNTLCQANPAGVIVAGTSQVGCDYYYNDLISGTASGSDGNWTTTDTPTILKNFLFDPRIHAGLFIETTSTVPDVLVATGPTTSTIRNQLELSGTGWTGSGLFRHEGTNNNPNPAISPTPVVTADAITYTPVGTSCVLRVEIITGAITGSGEGFIPLTDPPVPSCYDDRNMTVRKYADGGLIQELQVNNQYWGRQCEAGYDCLMAYTAGFVTPGPPVTTGSTTIGYLI